MSNEPSLADLCRPLSAKVMPKSSMYDGLTGEVSTQQSALARQRQSEGGRHATKMKRAQAKRAKERSTKIEES
jgi:aryl-alcohol dehydrogenase-like predicted oxidoreductase